MLLKNTDGVALQVELMVEEAYCSIVLPLAAEEGTILHEERMCYNAVQSFVAGCQTEFLACLSTHTRLLGYRAEAMVNGNIPFSQQYPLGAGPIGTFVGDDDPEPSSIGAIIDWYFDPDDVAAGSRTVVSHNTIPGIDQAGTDGNYLTSTLITALRTFAGVIFSADFGYDDTANGGDVLRWRRVNKILRGAVDQSVRAAIAYTVKALVGSVEKRLYPPRR